MMSASSNVDWEPPDNPNPTKILYEARSDAVAKRYENALAKHVWFHENALKHQPSLYGVRLSFALGYWSLLGEEYPPAMDQLKAIRDDGEKNIRNGTGNHEAFHDFETINSILNDEDRTIELFHWLDVSNTDLAKSVYRLAQPALIAAEEYQLCGRYIDPDKSFQLILRAYRAMKPYTRDLIRDKSYQEFREWCFSHESATLVGLLKLNNRSVDADRIAMEALKEWDDPGFKQQLDGAKNGELPKPYP